MENKSEHHNSQTLSTDLEPVNTIKAQKTHKNIQHFTATMASTTITSDTIPVPETATGTDKTGGVWLIKEERVDHGDEDFFNQKHRIDNQASLFLTNDGIKKEFNDTKKKGRVIRI